MAWTTGADLLQWIADTLKVATADLPAAWTRQASAAVDLGYANLIGYIAGLGYSAAQLAGTVDQGAAWNLSQGIYELAGLAGGFADYKTEWFERFDLVARWEKGERKCVLTSGGVPIAPDGTSDIGGIGYGRTDAVEQLLNPDTTLDPPAWGAGTDWPW